MGRPPRPYTKEQVLNAIKGCATITATVAKRLNCDWRTAHIYINKWAETRQAYADEHETNGDFAEGKLLENIKKGDMAAIKYFLSKKYKERGYGDEVTQNIAIDTETPSLHIIIDDENAPNCPTD